MTLDEAIKIARDYRDLLKSRQCIICDSKVLPYDKLKIKEALTVILRNNSDECKALHEKIEETYYLLADFQYNAGDDLKLPSGTERMTEEGDITIDNMEEINSKLITEGNELFTYKYRLDRFEPLVTRERRLLMSELAKMGF